MTGTTNTGANSGTSTETIAATEAAASTTSSSAPMQTYSGGGGGGGGGSSGGGGSVALPEIPFDVPEGAPSSEEFSEAVKSGAFPTKAVLIGAAALGALYFLTRKRKATR